MDPFVGIHAASSAEHTNHAGHMIQTSCWNALLWVSLNSLKEIKQMKRQSSSSTRLIRSFLWSNYFIFFLEMGLGRLLRSELPNRKLPCCSLTEMWRMIRCSQKSKQPAATFSSYKIFMNRDGTCTDSVLVSLCDCKCFIFRLQAFLTWTLRHRGSLNKLKEAGDLQKREHWRLMLFMLSAERHAILCEWSRITFCNKVEISEESLCLSFYFDSVCKAHEHFWYLMRRSQTRNRL